METLSNIVYVPVRLIRTLPGGMVVQGLVVAVLLLLAAKWWTGSVPFGLDQYFAKVPVVGSLFEEKRTNPWDNGHLAPVPVTPTMTAPSMSNLPSSTTANSVIPNSMSGPISTANPNTEAVPISAPAPVAPVQVGDKATMVPVLAQAQGGN
jgi:hypothetical protein